LISAANTWPHAAINRQTDRQIAFFTAILPQTKRMKDENEAASTGNEAQSVAANLCLSASTDRFQLRSERTPQISESAMGYSEKANTS
jgi:hypothetical protein